MWNEIFKVRPSDYIFLDLLDLTYRTAESVFNGDLDCVQLYGLNQDLQEYLVWIASDRASVILGKRSGVAQRMLSVHLNLIIWHCMNHRLELARADAIDEVVGVNHFQSCMDKLHTLFSTSHKNQRDLAKCATKLDNQINKIGCVLSARWAAS